MLKCAELFKNLLDEKEFHYDYREFDDGKVSIDFPYSGKVARCIFGGDEGEYLSIYIIYESVPENKLAEAVFACNSLNSEYKWVKFYVDDDKDLMLQDDAILSLDNAADESMELLIRIFNIANEAKATLMKAIYA